MRAVLGFAVSLSALVVGTATTGACSAEGTAPFTEQRVVDAVEPTPTQSKLPPTSTTPTNTSDAGPGTDGGKSDASTADAAPPAPTPGQPCAKLDQIFTKSCGACGTQTALCFSEDGGAGSVSDYSACSGEVAGGCVAGTTEDVDCGNCGTQKRVCDKACKWSIAACVQPPGACKAGTSEYTIVGCPTVNTYRQRTCQSACNWSSYSTCAPPSNAIVVDIIGTVGQVAATTVTLSAAQMAAAMPHSGSCPAAALLPGDYPYEYVEVRNLTGKAATIAVYTSIPAGGKSLYGSLAGYRLPFVPTDDTARLQCAFGPTSSTMSKIALAAGTSMLVYLRSYYVYSASSPASTTGAVNVNVRTDVVL